MTRADGGGETSPLVSVFQALRTRPPTWDVAIGRLRGPGWIPGVALMTATEGPFQALLARIGEQTQGLPWVRHFFEGTDVVSQMQPQFYPVTYQHVTHVYHRGASCCRYYRLRPGHYCARCPLVSHEERLRRQRAMSQMTGGGTNAPLSSLWRPGPRCVGQGRRPPDREPRRWDIVSAG